MYFHLIFVVKKVYSFSANLKKKISEALLEMHKLPEWQPQLEEWNIERYTEIDDSLYDLEASLMELCKGLSLSSVYYWTTAMYCAITTSMYCSDNFTTIPV